MLRIQMDFSDEMQVGDKNLLDFQENQQVRKKILIADSFPIVRQGLRVILEAESTTHEIYEADEVDGVWDLMNSIGPDVVFLDTYLLNKSTLGFVKTMRNKDKDANKEMKLFVFTEHRDKQHVLSFVSAGVDGYIVKGCPHFSLETYIHYVFHIGFVISPDIQRLALDWMRELRPELTDSEKRILHLGTGGLSNDEIASVLDLSIGTVNNHFSNIYRKIPWVNSRAEVISWAWINKDVLL